MPSLLLSYRWWWSFHINLSPVWRSIDTDTDSISHHTSQCGVKADLKDRLTCEKVNSRGNHELDNKKCHRIICANSWCMAVLVFKTYLIMLSDLKIWGKALFCFCSQSNAFACFFQMKGLHFFSGLRSTLVCLVILCLFAVHFLNAAQLLTNWCFPNLFVFCLFCSFS